MRSEFPFSVFKRQDRKHFLVRFKNEAGEYLSAVNTKMETRQTAIEAAFKMLSEGIPQKSGNVSAKVYSLRQTMRGADFTKADAEFLVKELKRQGIIRTAVFAQTKQDRYFGEFLLDFWTWDKSEYIAEKLRKQHDLHKPYVREQRQAAARYWLPKLDGKLLGELTKADIEGFIQSLDSVPMSPLRKNGVIRAGTIALKWAYAKELIERDITAGIVYYSAKPKERQILTPELAQAVFAVQWKNESAKLANMLAMLTGMRAGEIQGLRVCDLGEDCLYIKHSWNFEDGLKCPKNTESRIVELPFAHVTQALLKQAEANPHGYSMDSYVFWGERKAGKPMENRLFLKGLRGALQTAGMSKEGAAGYTFHAWRHFFTSYMRGRVDTKLLQSQTGHKTTAMLEHYAAHRIAGDSEQIRRAQLEAFSELLPQKAVAVCK